MNNLCPVCQNKISIDDKCCSVCGFSDLHKNFNMQEERDNWLFSVVFPYKNLWKKVNTVSNKCNKSDAVKEPEQELCPICRKRLTNDLKECPICGFSDIHKSFESDKEMEEWYSEKVLPYRDSKINTSDFDIYPIGQSFIDELYDELYDEYLKKMFTVGDKLLISYSGTQDMVIIPDGVSCIHANAFKGCKNLKSIIFPDSVKIILREAFSECENLEYISLSNNIKYIQPNVFNDTKYFKNNFNWGNGFLYIGKYLISCVWIPYNKTEIRHGTELIADCAGVSLFNKQEKLLLPNTLKYIGYKAFARLPFEEIVIPESVVSIGDGAFGCCSSKLRKITIPESVKLMGDIFGRSLIKKKVTIKCKIGSEAYKYAEANDIRCEAIY